LFLLRNLWSTKSVEYLDVTPIKSPLTTRIKSIDGQNVTFDYKDYRVAGKKRRWHWLIKNLFGVLRCIFCPNVLSKSTWFLSSTWKRQKTAFEKT
jgi:hypothetical protein